MKNARINKKPRSNKIIEEVKRDFKSCDPNKLEEWFKASKGRRNRQLNLNALKGR